MLKHRHCAAEGRMTIQHCAGTCHFQVPWLAGLPVPLASINNKRAGRLEQVQMSARICFWANAEAGLGWRLCLQGHVLQNCKKSTTARVIDIPPGLSRSRPSRPSVLTCT